MMRTGDHMTQYGYVDALTCSVSGEGLPTPHGMVTP